MGTKMAVAFANIYVAIETEFINKSPHKPLVWKRFIDNIFSLWNVDKEEIDLFIELANNHHPTITFTAEVPETEAAFLDSCIYKGERFKKESNPRCAYTPQTDRNFPIHLFLFMSPPRG